MRFVAFFILFIGVNALAKVPRELLQISHHENVNSTVLIVDKTERQLYVYKEKSGKIELDKQFPVDIGKGAGKKEKRGDLKTPEGIYFLLSTKTQPEIPFGTYGKLAFISNFPNPYDKLDKKTGDGIWLHGVPDNVSLERGSRGCVVVRNETLDYLKVLVTTGTTALIIREKIDWADSVDEAQKGPILEKLSSWIQAWKSKSDTYFDFYSSVFKSSQFKSYSKFENHKRNVFKFNEKIDVKFDPLLIIKDKDQIVVTGIQIYNGNTLSDRGIKTVYFKTENNSDKIIAEEWLPTIFSATALEALASDSKIHSLKN